MALIVTPRQLSQRAQFYQQLGQLTSAGVTVPLALDLLARNPPAASFRAPIREMSAQLAGGATVADAMQFLGDWVPAFDLALVRAAEHSGRLDAIFKMLAGYYNHRAALARQLISGLAYPMFVFHFAIFLFPFVMWFQGKLSGVGYFMESFGVLIPIYAVVYFLIFAGQGKRGLEWRIITEKVCRRVPVLGAARQALALARLSAALEALLTAGVTVIEAWEMAAAGCGSPAIWRTVRTWRPDLTNGQTPSEAIHASPEEFPEVFANMYHTGEISGQLDETLERLHVYYEEEATRKLGILATWVPKLVYFCVVGVVVYFIFSIFMGHMKDLNDAMKM